MRKCSLVGLIHNLFCCCCWICWACYPAIGGCGEKPNRFGVKALVDFLEIVVAFAVVEVLRSYCTLSNNTTEEKYSYKALHTKLYLSKSTQVLALKYTYTYSLCRMAFVRMIPITSLGYKY